MAQRPMTYADALRRVHALRGFYIHATAYVLVNLLLFAIDWLTPGNSWFYWPLLVWGFGLASHGAFVLLFGGAPFAKWEERKVRKLLGYGPAADGENAGVSQPTS
jgi:2TM domain